MIIPVRLKIAVFTVCLSAVSGAHAENPAAATTAPASHTLFAPAPSAPSFAPRAHAFSLDLAALRAHLSNAPTFRDDAPLHTYALPLALPAPDGVFTDCLVAEAPVMHPDLQAKFPLIRSYIVQTADRSASGRFNLTPHGLSAMLRTPVGVWMIDPPDPKNAALVSAFWLRDRAAAAGMLDWTCHTVEGVHGLGARADIDPPTTTRSDRGPGTQTRRTLRLAVACTGEFGAHQATLRGNAPNQADALAAIVTNVSRANVVFEGDLAVSFQLVAGNDQLAYFDPATDPYADTCDGTGGADCSGPYLATNISNLNSVIGNANFDIGHLLTRVFGGVAYLSSVCGTNKAGGISGIPRGGDVNDLAFLVLIHELGHQFGATHTFSGTRGRCGNNATLSSAWEAGSGSSPMAYAGACPVGSAPPSDNVAVFADPYFHHGSINQMRNFLTGASCPVQSASTNTPPSFTSTTPNLSIPPETPFVLSATATDIDGNSLLFSWEQFDSGVRRPISGDGSEDNGQGALFRIFPPAAANHRIFPQISDVLTGIPTPGERLPTITNVVRRFRCIVRDNAPGAGASVVSAFTDLTIASGASRFAFTSPAADAQIAPGPTIITWSVGNTNLAPIACSSVAIALSTDGGLTFSAPITTVPNTGSASVNLPPNVPNARLRLSAVGNVFFNISPAFSVRPCPGDFNRDGVVSVQDIFEFLAAWFAASPTADLDASNTVGVQDIFEFLTRWFTPCP